MYEALLWWLLTVLQFDRLLSDDEDDDDYTLVRARTPSTPQKLTHSREAEPVHPPHENNHPEAVSVGVLRVACARVSRGVHTDGVVRAHRPLSNRLHAAGLLMYRRSSSFTLAGHPRATIRCAARPMRFAPELCRSLFTQRRIEQEIDQEVRL